MMKINTDTAGYFVLGVNTQAINYGWICPTCGRVYSPTTIMCFYCPGNSLGVFAATSGDEKKSDEEDPK